VDGSIYMLINVDLGSTSGCIVGVSSIGITLTCDIIRSITGNAGVREWHIGVCGYEQGRLKWYIGITRRRIKELESAGEIKRIRQ